jgi:hypothetical protein
MEIDRDPTVVVAELEPAAFGAWSVDFFHHTVRHSNERGEPGGHDVNPEVSTRPTVASLAEDRSDLAAQNGKQHPVEKAATTGWGRRGFDRWSRFGRRQHRAIGRSRSGWWRFRARQGRKIGDRGWAAGRLGLVSWNRHRDQHGDYEEDQTPPNAGRAQHDSEVTAVFALHLRGTRGT